MRRTPTHRLEASWPIESDRASLANLKDEAHEDLRQACDRLGAVMLGNPLWHVRHGVAPSLSVTADAYLPSRPHDLVDMGLLEPDPTTTRRQQASDTTQKEI